MSILHTIPHGDGYITGIQCDPQTVVYRPATEDEIAALSRPPGRGAARPEAPAAETAPEPEENAETDDVPEDAVDAPRRRGRPPKVR